MKKSTQNRIRFLIISLLAVSYFTLHTMLTNILGVSGFRTVFLIFVFGFIYQGVEYYFTIGDENDPPKADVRSFFFGGLLIPEIVFSMLKNLNVFGMRDSFEATQLCILIILLYRIVKDLIAWMILISKDKK